MVFPHRIRWRPTSKESITNPRFSTLPTNPFVEILHLRILPPKPDTTNIKVFSVFGDKEVIAEPRILELVNHELSRDVTFSSTRQLHLQRRSHARLAPLFIVDIPTTGWQFILDSRKGVTQWYVDAISDNHRQEAPTVHGFFYEKLVPFRWEVNNLLVALQRAYLCLPFQNRNVSVENGNHYVVNILLKIRGPPTGPFTKFTTHFVSADTKLVDFFDILAGEEVDDGFTLVQWAWSKDTEKYDIFKCNRYSEARIQNKTFKDAGWVGKEIWLFPTCH